MDRTAAGIHRRSLLRLVGAGALAGTAASTPLAAALAAPAPVVPLQGVQALGSRAARLAPGGTGLHLAATDSWIRLPGSNPPYHPDPMAPGGLTTWGLGFADVTGLSRAQRQNQRGHAEAPAPMLWCDADQEVRIRLTNLGLQVRPDLTDSHTIHWHGFRNAIPLFDGVPELSIAVPIGRSFTYFYRPRDPGTYMYHCHFEDVEHVSMGMTGVVFVRPRQNQGTETDGGGQPIPAGRYCYDDGVQPGEPSSTAYDREWTFMLTEAWTQEHFEGAHIQEHDWSDYDADVWLMNGRSYPDTVLANGRGRNANGDLVAPPGHPELRYQPLSSLVRCNSGERVLLRLANLGFQQQSMTLAGIPMRVVGQDATLLRGRDGTDQSFTTDTLHLGPGESVDAIFVAPPVSGLQRFLLYNRNLATLTNPGTSGLGGQLTHIRVFPQSQPLPPQTTPNH